MDSLEADDRFPQWAWPSPDRFTSICPLPLCRRGHRSYIRTRIGAVSEKTAPIYVLPRNASLLLDDVRSLEALGALCDLELNSLAFDERLESVAPDRGEVDEYILATFLLDEAKALAVVKPLNGAFCQRVSPPFSDSKSVTNSA